MLPALGQISCDSWGLASHLCAFWLVLHRPPERLLPKFILLLGRQENRVLSSQNSCSCFKSHSCGSLALKSSRGFPGVPESKPPRPPTWASYPTLRSTSPQAHWPLFHLSQVWALHLLGPGSKMPFPGSSGGLSIPTFWF